VTRSVFETNCPNCSPIHVFVKINT
jgi:hypothetical protein